MNKKIIGMLGMLALCACGSRTVDYSHPIGDTILVDSVYYVVTDHVVHGDTIMDHIEEINCEVYDSLMRVIHRGDNIRANNAVALSLAEQEGDFDRAMEIERENTEAEEAMGNAIDEYVDHIEWCPTCKLLNNY